MPDLETATTLFWGQVSRSRTKDHGALRHVLKELIEWTGRFPELRFVWEERPDHRKVMKFCLGDRDVSFWAAWPQGRDGARLTLLGSGDPTYPEVLRRLACEELAKIAGGAICEKPEIPFRILTDLDKRRQLKRLLKQLLSQLTGRTITTHVPAPTQPVSLPDRTEFQAELKSRFDCATNWGWSFIEIEAASLHFALGYPACAASLALCCDVMRESMMVGDLLTESPMKWVGGPVETVRYLLPRHPPLPTPPAELAQPAPTSEYQPSGEDTRSRALREVTVRPGQGEFRLKLVERYGRRCLVTGCSTLAALEAAHISPWRGEDDNAPENGLLLRADIHTLFDQDLLGIEPASLRVELHPSIERDYGELKGRILDVQADRRPSATALNQRNDRFRNRFTKPARE